jgi:secreted protein with Ig-like and vWFA domain
MFTKPDLRNYTDGMSNDEILDSVADAIEQILGAGSASLVFKTLELVYQLNTKLIPGRIDHFQIALFKLLGPLAASKITIQAASEMKKRRLG